MRLQFLQQDNARSTNNYENLYLCTAQLEVAFAFFFVVNFSPKNNI